MLDHITFAVFGWLYGVTNAVGDWLNGVALDALQRIHERRYGREAYPEVD